MPLKVLAVDDSKTIRVIVKKAFTPYDVTFFEAENGVEGLTVAAREKPDLIVLDITMPIMNGVEMLQRMKADATLKKIPVIMLTAESGKENVLNIVKMGVANYMVKPFKGEQLIERVLKVLRLEPRKDGAGAPGGGAQYFREEGGFVILRLPDKINRAVVADIETTLNEKLPKMGVGATKRLICDASGVGELNVLFVKFLVTLDELCQKTNIALRFVVGTALGGELKNFKETSGFVVHGTLAEAREGTM